MRYKLLALLTVSGLLAGCASPGAEAVRTGQAASIVSRPASQFDYAFNEQQPAVEPKTAKSGLGLSNDDCSCQLHPHGSASTQR